MSTDMHIRSSETGVVRVFHIDLPKEAVERFTTQAGTGEWPLQYALGAKQLRNGFVEVVAIADLDAMTLSQYLGKAYDVPTSELRAMRAQLDRLEGHVVILPSQSFDRTEQSLTISQPLRWIGTFSEPKADMTGTPINTASAHGMVSTPEASAGGSGVPGWLWIALGLLMAGAFAVFGLVA